MSRYSSMVAIYETHAQAEDAVKALQRARVDMKNISIASRDKHTEEHVGYCNTGPRMLYWGEFGALWGGICGLLFGAAFVAIPGIGRVLVAGPLVGWIVGALESVALIGGMGALGAGLYGMGIPKDSALEYERALERNQFVLVAHGIDDEVTAARRVISTTASASVALYPAERAEKAATPVTVSHGIA